MISSDSQRGFTLVEVVVASMIGTLVLVAAVSLISTTLDVESELDSGSGLSRDAHLAVARFGTDLQHADSLLLAGGSALDLLTAAGDTIRYAWSGTSLDPLTRQVNGNAAQTVAADVDTVTFTSSILTRIVSREKFVATFVTDTIAAFEVGDWDSWAASTSCDVVRRTFPLYWHNWYVAEEFWPAEGVDILTSAHIRAAAIDQNPPDVDILVDVYEADSGGSGYPARHLATGRLDRFNLTGTFAWHEVALTIVDSTPVMGGGHYWIVISPDMSANLYAGSLEYDELLNCLPGDIPANDMTYRETNNGGNTWETPVDTQEIFFRVVGLQTVWTLEEVADTLVTTTGVEYTLRLLDGEERVLRAGTISLLDP